MDKPKRLIVGMSGASGAPLTLALLELLRRSHPDVESHLVVTRGGAMTLRQECGKEVAELAALADVVHQNENIGDSIASGSFRTLGMAVVPCSMKTVAGIVSGYSDNLLLRAADVCLKERRTLVLAARESPLSTLHLHNLYKASNYGAVILPPMQTYYNHPATPQDMARHTAARILAQFGLDTDTPEWEGMTQ